MGAEQILYHYNCSILEKIRSFLIIMGAEQILYHHNGSGFFTIIIGAEKILCQLYKKADALSSLW